VHYVIMVAVVPGVLGLVAFTVVRLLVGSSTSSRVAWAYCAGLVTVYTWQGVYLFITFGDRVFATGFGWLLLLAIATSYVIPKWWYELYASLGRIPFRDAVDYESPGNKRREAIAIGVVAVVAVVLTALQVWSSVR